MGLRKEHPPKRFPRTRVRLVLADWWDDITRSSLRRPQNHQQARKAGGSVFDIIPAVSSAQAIAALLRVEPLLGFTVDAGVLRRDGYETRKKFINDLCSRLKAEFNDQCSRAVGPRPPSARARKSSGA